MLLFSFMLIRVAMFLLRVNVLVPGKGEGGGGSLKFGVSQHVFEDRKLSPPTSF